MSLNQEKIERAKAFAGRSHYSRSPNYSITFDPRRLKDNLVAYNKDLEDTTLDVKECVKFLTPKFQRKNNKWSLEKKIKFIEALISGLKTKIIFFSLNRDSMSDCLTLDGLQRTTTLAEFINGDFPVLGDIYYKEIASTAVFMNTRIELLVYEFRSERQAVEFYIDMNDGITHSPEDIKVAKEYLETLPEDKF